MHADYVFFGVVCAEMYSFDFTQHSVAVVLRAEKL